MQAAYAHNHAIASDIYHGYLEDAHFVLEDFKVASHTESLNKMNILWGQLHSAGGAKYIYADPHSDLYSQEWLFEKGKHVIDELIEDAEKSNMSNTLKTLKEIRKIMEDKNLIN